MVHKIRKILFLFILILCMMPTVFGADYIFNGETLPATSSYQDTYYGVETMKNILDDLEITYDDTTILSFTYYANQALKFWRATYDENTTPLNICFIKYTTYTDRFVMIPSNGTFDDDLPYMYLNTTYNDTYAQCSAFSSWKYDSDGNISGVTSSSINYITVKTSEYSISNGTQNIQKNGFVQEGSVLYYDKLLAPIKSFSTAGRSATTGYSWYFVGNLIRFTEEPDVDIPGGDDTESGDTGGGTGGDTGGGTGSTDLTMTNAKIDQLNKHAEEIQKNMLTSGDMQGIISNETDKVINFMSGDADFSGENTNISSGDIVGAIGYTPPDDPYANFWWELTEILNNALTGTNRTLTLQAIKNTYTISIDDIGWNPPEALRTFLTLLSTTVVCWVLVKYIKVTIDKLSSGSIDEALAMNEESGIVDLF